MRASAGSRSPRPPSRARPAAAARTLTSRSLAVRSAALETLETHRALMKRSRDAVESARARLPRAPAPGCEGPSAAQPVPGAQRPEDLACAFGCGRPSPFRPCFVVDWGRRVLVRAPALRVCADHRATLAMILRHAVLDTELRDGRAGAPVAAQVLFDVV